MPKKHMQKLFSNNSEKPHHSCMLAVAVCCIKVEIKLEIRVETEHIANLSFMPKNFFCN